MRFNKYLKDLHCEARAQYLNWRIAGRPRTEESHSNMRVNRLCFKYYGFRVSLKCKDSTSFWKHVRKIANSKIPPASKVGNNVGSAKITDM